MFYDLVRQLNKLENDHIAICANYEKKIVFPITSINKKYFVSSLNFYNFGIQNLQNNHATMIIFAQHNTKKKTESSSHVFGFLFTGKLPS